MAAETEEEGRKDERKTRPARRRGERSKNIFYIFFGLECDLALRTHVRNVALAARAHIKPHSRLAR